MKERKRGNEKESKGARHIKRVEDLTRKETKEEHNPGERKGKAKERDT